MLFRSVDPNEPTPSYSTRRSAKGRVQSQASAEIRRQQLKKHSVVIVAGEGADPDEQSQAAVGKKVVDIDEPM